MLLAVALWSFFLLFLFLLCAHSRNWWSNCFTTRFFFRAVGSFKTSGGQVVAPKSFVGEGFASIPVITWGRLSPQSPLFLRPRCFAFFYLSFCRLHFQTMWHWHGFISVHYPPTFIVQQNTLARISYYCLKKCSRNNLVRKPQLNSLQLSIFDGTKLCTSKSIFT